MVTDKKWKIFSIVGVSVVQWRNAQGTLAGGLEGFGDEAGDLTLYLAGGGPAVCV